jgi:hypothetical protein
MSTDVLRSQGGGGTEGPWGAVAGGSGLSVGQAVPENDLNRIVSNLGHRRMVQCQLYGTVEAASGKIVNIL